MSIATQIEVIQHAAINGIGTNHSFLWLTWGSLHFGFRECKREHMPIHEQGCDSLSVNHSISHGPYASKWVSTRKSVSKKEDKPKHTNQLFGVDMSHAKIREHFLGGNKIQLLFARTPAACDRGLTGGNHCSADPVGTTLKSNIF